MRRLSHARMHGRWIQPMWLEPNRQGHETGQDDRKLSSRIKRRLVKETFQCLSHDAVQLHGIHAISTIATEHGQLVHPR